MATASTGLMASTGLCIGASAKSVFEGIGGKGLSGAARGVTGDSDLGDGAARRALTHDASSWSIASSDNPAL